MPHFDREHTLHALGLRHVAGMDEAGRGPLAGPVAAAAVILDPAALPDGLDDSKALTASQREKLFGVIMAQAIAVGIGFSAPAEIDRINIRQATHMAWRRALASLWVRPHHVLLDGNDLPKDFGIPGETIVKGDALSLSIAAASIIAKVTRDRLMTRLHHHHPAYGFARHKGYSTAHHLDALRRHGPSSAHRMSFSPCRGEAELEASKPEASSIV